MKKSKLWISWLLVVLLLLSVTACSGGAAPSSTASDTSSADASSEPASEAEPESSDSSEEAADGDVKEIEVIHIHTYLMDGFEQLAEDFMAENPDIKIKLTISNPDTVHTYMTTGFQSGQDGLDVYGTNGNKEARLKNYVDQGLAVCLDGLIDTTGYPQMAIDRGKIDGKQYMSPGAFGDIWPIFYNQEIFEENGLEEPKTYDDLIAICDELLELGIQPMTVAGTDVWHIGRYFWSLVTSESPDWAEDFNNQRATFNDDRFKQGAVLMREWAEAGYFGDTWSTLDTNGSYLEFTSGKAAMTAVVSNSITILHEAEFDFSAFYFPTRDGKSVMIPTTDCWSPSCWSVYSKSKYQEEALKFVNYTLDFDSGANQLFADLAPNIPFVDEVTSPEPIFEKCKTGDLIIPLWSDQITYIEKDGINGYEVLNSVEQQLLYGEIDIDGAIEMLEDAVDYEKEYPFLVNW